MQRRVSASALRSVVRRTSAVALAAGAMALVSPLFAPPVAGATGAPVAVHAARWAAAGSPVPGPPLPTGAVRGHRLGPRVYPGGGVIAYGSARNGSPGMPASVNSPIVTMASAGAGGGYWLVGADGGVFAVGGAPYEGSTGAITLQGPIVAMAATPDDRGYWLGALDGGVFAFGDAQFYGSMGATTLNEPIVGMTSTADGGGYWLVASDGGIFAFGDARYYGSTGGMALNSAIVGMAATPDGKGYWLVAGDGGIFTYGDAVDHGSLGGQPLNAWINGMAVTPDGKGYWLVGADGGVFTFGDAKFYGSLSTGGAATPVISLVPSPGGTGYWLLDPDAWNYSFANPPPNGSFPGSAQIVAAADSQVRPDPDTGYFCNPYGPCEAWCALFATWAWGQGGVPIGSMAFTGNIFYWAQQNGIVFPATVSPVPGDIVLYGTGPGSTSTSVHTGIVAQVWPDGAVVTIEGDAGPGATGQLAVIVNGPYLPTHSSFYNGVPIYAFAQP